MSNVVFSIAARKTNGTGYARKLRNQGLLPIVAYCKQEKPRHFSLSYKDFYQEYSKGNILARVAELKCGDKVFQAIAKEVQIDPVSDCPIHIDFQLIKEHEPIKVAVGINILNKAQSPGLKKGGALHIIHRKVQLSCLPKDIPHFLDVDINGLEIGNNICINDIKIPEGITPVLRSNFTILTIVGRVEEEKDEQVTVEKTAE